MLSCIVFCLGVALQAGASSSGTALPTFILGRFFAGVGVGLVSTLIPMYQSECAPKWIRGAVISCYQWAVTIGIVLASVTNNATKDRPSDSAWQIPICVQFIWAAVLFLGMLWLPEVNTYPDRPLIYIADVGCILASHRGGWWGRAVLALPRSLCLV